MSAEPMGELFWESGARPAAQGRELMFFPGVPLHGKSPENSVLVAVIDSGIAQTHPQLAGFIRACEDFSGDGLEDRLGHGTAVALQLLYANGQSDPPIAILSAKVTDAQGRIRQQAVVDAIEWVAEQGARIVNLSLGFRGGADKHQNLCAAIARHPDILFSAAAGNDGPSVEVCPAACGLDNVLAVGATDVSGKPAGYSGAGQVYAPGDASFQEEWFYFYERGQALARSGHLQEARREYEASLAAQVNAESEFQLGVLDLSDEKPDAALIRLTEAIKLNPSFAEAHAMLGAARFLLGDYARAEDALRTSIELYPTDAASIRGRAGAHFNLGLTLMNLGRSDDAKTQFETVKALVPDYPSIDEMLASVAT
ncbi:MAG: S8 family serine peptidase [Thiobacillus sp.]